MRGFVNRHGEIDELNAVLFSEDGEHLFVSVYLIAGTAGAGKTSLAVHWAYQVQDRFPDGQLYVNLRGYDPGEPVGAHEALRRFLTALGADPQSIPQDLDDAAALYRSLLADRRVLVVLDNAATAAQVRPLLPGSANCLVIVTSRSRLSGLAVRDGARRLTLGTLPMAEAVALLRAVTAGYRPADDAHKLAELARLCARLPLALRIAAERAASHPHLRIDDLIADLRDESAIWDALSTGEDEDADAVRTVFAWSYRSLPEPAARVFRLLGLHPGPEFGVHAAAALVGITASRTRQLLDSLVGAHLVEQTGPDRYEFHDLLRAYATDQAQRKESPGERAAALHRVLTWYLHTADTVQGWVSPDEERLVPASAESDVHTLTFPDYNAAVDWSEIEHANMLRSVRAAEAAGLDRLTWQLASVLWNARPSSASVTDSLAVDRIGLAAAGRLGDRAAEGLLLTCLGVDQTRMNRFSESLELHQSALAIRRDVGDQSGEADSLNLIGLTHLWTRKLDDAALNFEAAIALFQELGSAHWAANSLSNLASTHYRAGRLTDAETAVREALAAHRSLDNRRGEGNALRLLSDVRCEQGDVTAALQAAQDALDIALDLRHDRLEGFWLITLGNAQQASGEFADALESYQRSAVLHRRLGDRSREAVAWQGAGETYRRLDRTDEAADFHRQAATTHRELNDPWNEALALDGLAAALLGEDAEAARRHWTAALELIAEYDDARAAQMRERIGRALVISS